MLNQSFLVPAFMCYEDWVVTCNAPEAPETALRWKQYLLGQYMVRVKELFHGNQKVKQWGIESGDEMFGLHAFEVSNQEPACVAVLSLVSNDDIEATSTMSMFWTALISANENIAELPNMQETWIIQVKGDGSILLAHLQNYDGTTMEITLENAHGTIQMPGYAIGQCDEHKFFEEMQKVGWFCFNGHGYGKGFEIVDPQGYTIENSLTNLHKHSKSKALAIDEATQLYVDLASVASNLKDHLISNPIIIISNSTKEVVWTTKELG